ncbi:MAG: HDOD domain-containing protein [Tepidisphaeraceae bacterium]|jgi:HD-like signal output (HDOD) protein/signal transduction histidine kinase
MSSTPDQLQAKRIELILQQLEQLPTLPVVAVRVLEAAADSETTIPQIVSLISGDVSLTARILQLVHRADLGVRGQVSTLDRAVVLLGFEAVRSAVLALSVFETFNAPSGQFSAFSRQEFWKHSIAVACGAELICEATAAVYGPQTGPDPSEGFVCGLLHDIGKVALDCILPKSFARVVEAAELLRGNIADVERTVIGLDHMVIGKRLCERWNLPQIIRECAWLHGQTPEALPSTVKYPRMVNLITLADLLVRQQHLGYSGNYNFPINLDKLIEAVGLSREIVDTATAKLIERIEARAGALQLSSATSRELYQQALARANQELGRVSGQLAAKNRRLTVRARFFDALSEFQSELRPDSPPQMVLQAIGQTAVGILGVTSVAAFSLMPGQDFAEVLLFDEAGEIFETSLVDCSQRPGPRQPGDGPVLHADDELDWLLSAISPRLAGDQRYWICLEAEATCIGGVVWGAASGEAQRLGTQVQELSAIAGGWGLALRTAQIREEARALSEQLAETNRRLQSAQNEIMRSKMMISVGEMAAGAAHEMNNPLAVISGRSQLLASQLTDPKHQAMAHLIHDQSHRLSEIISELMDFAKPVPPQPRECDPAELISRALHDAKQHTDPADRTIEVTMGDVPPVVVDPLQVSAALTEVIDNALLATDPASGHLTINTAFDPYSSRVAVTITDNGCGMDEATLKRAFDPFFSSKPAGRRRGMGLPKALRWVESSGGSMRLESRPQQGTRTLILLPTARPLDDNAAQGQRKAAT